jgi:hypothetical protein
MLVLGKHTSYIFGGKPQAGAEIASGDLVCRNATYG